MQITSLAIGGLFVLSLALIGVVVALAFMLRATRALNRQLVPREQNILADRERLWKLNDALAKMLASPDLTARLRITADAISGLGWQEATILLFERSPHGTFTTPLKISRTISNKPNVTTPDASVWQNRLSAVYPKREFGVAQYILAKPEQTAWNDEDVLFIPLRFSDGRLAGVIDLCEPIEGVRPTEERLRPLTILAATAPYRDTVAVFVSGQFDAKYGPRSEAVSVAARAAGMRASHVVSPGTAHDWHTVQWALTTQLGPIYQQLGVERPGA